MPYPRSVLVTRARSVFRKYFRDHGRTFPWRARNTTPYGILIAEMLLRQTRAEQVAVIWPALVDRYPDPRSLSNAVPQELYELIHPLGLGRQRAAALIDLGTALEELHRGRVPRDLEALVRLPHVGLYTSHATACFAFGQRVPVVDVNVLRVLGRLFGEAFKPDNRRTPAAWDLAREILPETKSVRDHNYGLLDFSAEICTPHKPLCRKCPLNGACAWCEEHVWSKVDLTQVPPAPPPWPR